MRAFTLPWERRAAFFRALALPLAFLVATESLFVWLAVTPTWGFASSLTVLIALRLFLGVWVAVIAHRLVLLHSSNTVQRWFPAWTMRETKFAATGAMVMLICIFAGAVTYSICLAIDGRPGARSGWFDVTDWTSVVAMFAGTLLFTRYCLLFPEIAVSGRVDFALARSRARGQVINLFAIVGLFPFLLALLLSRMNSDDIPGLMVAVSSALVALTMVVEVVALSLSYQRIAREQEV